LHFDDEQNGDLDLKFDWKTRIIDVNKLETNEKDQIFGLL
jgi:hypothetical protein